MPCNGRQCLRSNMKVQKAFEEATVAADGYFAVPLITLILVTFREHNLTSNIPSLIKLADTASPMA